MDKSEYVQISITLKNDTCQSLKKHADLIHISRYIDYILSNEFSKKGGKND